MKRIGICGSRRRNSIQDFKLVCREFLAIYEPGDIIISGGCPDGADHFVEWLAEEKKIPICVFPPNWSKYGKYAGFHRNGYIADQSDVLIACVSLDRKGGTEDTIKKFLNKLPTGILITC